ncbi:glycosyltransferase [Rhodococcus sp. WS3]|nr:glycosyltransferase [Rhodococcus sp. WS3]
MHVGVVGDLPGGMAQVVSEYLAWDYEVCSVRGLRSTRGRRDFLSPITWVRSAFNIAITSRSAGKTVFIFHLSQGGAFIREGSLAFLARMLRIPVGIHLHGSNFVEFANRRPKLVRGILNQASTVFVLTDETGEKVKSLVDESVRVAKTRNGVSVPAAIVTKEQIVLFAGELSNRKGVDVLLDSWSQLGSVKEGWKLLLAGPDTMGIKTEDASIQVLGTVPHSAVKELQSRAAIAILPSRAEALPMFLLESMAHRCAVISTPVGQIESLLKDVGLVVTVGSDSALSEALSFLMEDSDARNNLGVLGQERILDEFSERIIAREMEHEWVRLSNEGCKENVA